MSTYIELKEEVFNEMDLPVDAKFNFNYEFSLAFNEANKNLSTPQNLIKDVIKNILIQKLEQNANKPHKTFFGKVGAFLSLVASKVLPFVNLNKKK
jgi:hypothetical protein